MKKILPFLFALLAGFSFKAQATHDIGGSLTYMCVAPNVYQVTYTHYSWYVLSNPNPGSFDLRITSPGCNMGRIIPMQFKSTSQGTPLLFMGASTPYSISELTATVTFSPTEAVCKDWILGVTAGLRMGGASLNNQTMVDLYTEATLKLEATINNTSPVFDPQNEPILIAAPFQPITLSVGAYDPDGDSLVYRLVNPLAGANQPIGNYKNFGTGSLTFTNRNPQPPFNTIPFGQPGHNPQYGVFPPVMSNYSSTYPIVSYNVNWVQGQQFNPATPYFDLNAATGDVSFIPMAFDTTGYNNFYIVSFQVDEYRKINGLNTKIGSVRRETYIYLGNVGSNVNPRLANRMLNNAPVQQTASVTIKPGSTFTYQVEGSDSNASNQVFLSSNAATALPGATFTVNSATKQTGTVTWTPAASHVRDQPYFLRIWAKDNASPLAGTHVETIAIRVSNNATTTGINSEMDKNAGFTAYPNPFTETLRFRFDLQSKAETIMISNLLGQPVDQIVISETALGQQEIQWKNASKHAAGIYVAKLISGNKTIQTLKFTKLQ